MNSETQLLAEAMNGLSFGGGGTLEDAFLIAGAQSVVLPLWNSPESSLPNTLLLLDFYSRLPGSANPKRRWREGMAWRRRRMAVLARKKRRQRCKRRQAKEANKGSGGGDGPGRGADDTAADADDDDYYYANGGGGGGGGGDDEEDGGDEEAEAAVVGLGAAGAEPFPVAHALAEAQRWLRTSSYNELRAAINGSRLVEATKRSLEGQLWDLVRRKPIMESTWIFSMTLHLRVSLLLLLFVNFYCYFLLLLLLLLPPS